ncbi:MAG: antibiotic biosynthesis monooxygenase [Deltaproteobacteria bacterium]|nr:antibiotic biosynthesis monooxygenase [Deltaproteobacteria bacterium]
MIVRVLMTRKMAKQFKRMDQALMPKLSELMIELRSLANRQPGYISGETLRNVNDPNEYLVISTWKTREAWNNWFANERRAEMEGKVDALMGSPTVYKVFSYD